MKLVNIALVLLGFAGLVWSANTLYRPQPNVGNSGLMPTNAPNVGDFLGCTAPNQVAWTQMGPRCQWYGTTGGSAPGAGSTVYLSPGNTLNTLSSSDSSAITRVPVTRTTTLQSLYVVFSIAPGATRMSTVTVMTNGVASALSVNVAGVATTGSDVVNAVSVPAGTEIGVRIMTAIGAPSSRTAWAFEGR